MDARSPAAAPPTPAPASTSNATTGAPSKRDYGWLAEALWGRIEQLKRYPASARLNRWEGKVVLRAVIKEDGRVADLKIAQSSGHDVLDQDALGLMQQASPIPLKQPLGNPQVIVHIPISYKLEQ
jgi:protein TonB